LEEKIQNRERDIGERYLGEDLRLSLERGTERLKKGVGLQKS